LSEIIKGEIEVSRALEILKTRSKVVPTVEEMRIILRDCANADNPLHGIITARDLVQNVLINLESVEDKVAVATCPEFGLIGDRFGDYLS
jgi:signal-transduction protein with cAMP-binding, CBS, and nucleotidyltransferase domain